MPRPTAGGEVQQEARKGGRRRERAAAGSTSRRRCGPRVVCRIYKGVEA
jgi:hypothetical protein